MSHYFVEFLLQKSGGNLSLCYVFKNWQIFERMINLNGLLHWNVKIDDIVHNQSFFTMFSQVWLEKWKKMTPNLAFHNKKWGDFRTKIWRYWHYWYSAGARQVPHLGAKIRFETSLVSVLSQCYTLFFLRLSSVQRGRNHLSSQPFASCWLTRTAEFTDSQLTST